MVQAITVKRRGVQALSFIAYVYDDHSVVAVTRRDFAPLRGVDLRLGHYRLAVGREALAGLSKDAAVHLIADALAQSTDTGPHHFPAPQEPGAPLGAMGVVGQLALDIRV